MKGEGELRRAVNTSGKASVRPQRRRDEEIIPFTLDQTKYRKPVSYSYLILAIYMSSSFLFFSPTS